MKEENDTPFLTTYFQFSLLHLPDMDYIYTKNPGESIKIEYRRGNNTNTLILKHIY